MESLNEILRTMTPEIIESAIFNGTLRALRAHRKEVTQERLQKPQCLAIAKKTGEQCTLAVIGDSDYCYLHRHNDE